MNSFNPQSWNRYAYVANSPLNSVDPLGLDDCQGKAGVVPSYDLKGKPHCHPDPTFQAAQGERQHVWDPDNPKENCYLDGAQVPCSVLLGSKAADGIVSGGLIAADQAVQCPNNVCSGWSPQLNAFVQFGSIIGGETGYGVIGEDAQNNLLITHAGGTPDSRDVQLISTIWGGIVGAVPFSQNLLVVYDARTNTIHIASDITNPYFWSDFIPLQQNAPPVH